MLKSRVVQHHSKQAWGEPWFLGCNLKQPCVVYRQSNIFILQAIFQHKQCYERRLRGVAGAWLRAGSFVMLEMAGLTLRLLLHAQNNPHSVCDINSTQKWLPSVWLRHFSPTCAVHTEDCGGWWLSGCHSSVAEQWLHKSAVLGLIPGDCWPFHFHPINSNMRWEF